MLSDSVKTVFAVIASIATITATTYTLSDKVGFKWTRPVLTWAPEYFKISSQAINEPFDIIVAREKHRDDCEVTGFKILIRDSNLQVFHATPSNATFSGPASDTIDLYAYKFYIREEDYDRIATGEATFMGEINYSCPEGTQLVSYPTDLKFTIYELIQFPE